MRITFAIPLMMLACVFALTAQQTAFAATITPATNEHDYKVGFRQGFKDYYIVAHAGNEGPPLVAGNSADLACQALARTTNDRYTFMIDNVTACEHGYVNGWKHWCKQYTDDCTEYVLDNSFPGSTLRQPDQ